MGERHVGRFTVPMRVNSLKSTPPMNPFSQRAILPAGCLLACLLLGPTAQAFPPAPHHLIYGLVRDEMGNPLSAENVEVVFEATSGTKLTTRIVARGQPGQNYELQVPMDSGVASDLYMATAMQPTVPFKIRVRIGELVYLPIEMSADYASLGRPGKKTRLNLTLGVDSDGDGLPDAWERAILAALGQSLTLAELQPGADSDGDGMSNLDEYVAGTYAFDNQDGYSLKIKGARGTATQLEFLAVRGRTYTIQGSPDLQHWAPVPFRLSTEGPDGLSTMTYVAQDVRVLPVEVDPPANAEPVRFFKLMIE